MRPSAGGDGRTVLGPSPKFIVPTFGLGASADGPPRTGGEDHLVRTPPDLGRMTAAAASGRHGRGPLPSLYLFGLKPPRETHEDHGLRVGLDSPLSGKRI